MENRFEQSPEEQGWKAPLPSRPDPTLRQTTHNVNGADQGVLRDNLCAWVREKLSDLLDSDGSIRPEQAAGIYAHLAICRSCAQEFEEMQHVVALVENLPPVELPCDFSGLILQRIENPHAPALPRALASPSTADMVSAVVASQPGQQNVSASLKITTAQTVKQKVAVLHNQHQQSHAQHTQSELLSRMTAGGILSAVLAYFLSTTWGRQIAASVLMPTCAWLSQIADVLRSVPVLTWMVGLIFSALAQFNAMLGHTYHIMGTAAAVGFALDAVICIAAYGFLTARRREAQMRF